MYKEVLRSIDGISIYPVISLGIFFLFFTGLMIRVAIMKKQEVNKLSAMPLMEEPVEDRIQDKRS